MSIKEKNPPIKDSYPSIKESLLKQFLYSAESYTKTSNEN